MRTRPIKALPPTAAVGMHYSWQFYLRLAFRFGSKMENSIVLAASGFHSRKGTMEKERKNVECKGNTVLKNSKPISYNLNYTAITISTC